MSLPMGNQDKMDVIKLRMPALKDDQRFRGSEAAATSASGGAWRRTAYSIRGFPSNSLQALLRRTRDATSLHEVTCIRNYRLSTSRGTSHRSTVRRGPQRLAPTSRTPAPPASAWRDSVAVAMPATSRLAERRSVAGTEPRWRRTRLPPSC